MIESSQRKLPTVKRFEHQQIASITEPFKRDDGKYDIRLISKGMNKEQIEYNFPPTKLSIALAKKRKKIPLTFNMRELIRSIIVEDYEKIGLNRERGNVRHLFYTNIIYALTRIMGVTNIDSLDTTINEAWKDIIESGIVTYEGMNVESGKGKLLKSYARYSPFSNFIICVEKESLLESLDWTSQLFKTTIITAGGQPSRSALRAFVRTLSQWKCDLNKPFFLLVITDLDPAGFFIQEAFASQIEKSLKYYNEDKGEVKDPIRLFLRLDQITNKLISEMGVPAKDQQAKTKQTIKSSKTKVKRFKVKLGEDFERLIIDGEMMKVELDVISEDLMEEEIARQLLLLIDDCSLILIPEIMEELEKQRILVIKDLFNSHKEEKIDSIIDEYLEPIKERMKEIIQIHQEKKNQILADFNKIDKLIDSIRFQIREEISNLIQTNIDKYNEYIESLVKDEREEIEKKEEEIADLQEKIDSIQEKIDTIKEEIDEKINFYKEEIWKIEDNLSKTQRHLIKKKSLLLDPHIIIRDQKTKIIETELKIFEEKTDTFKSQQKGKFGSYLRSIEKSFQDSLNNEKIPVFFYEIESDSNIQIQMAYLLTHPKLLLEENKSCLEHPKPAFQESNLLENALKPENIQNTKRNPDLSKFRNTFSDPFVKALKELVRKKLKPIPIELDTIVDLPKEYSDELNNLIKEIESEIKLNKIYSILNYHPEDLKSKKELINNALSN